jgi:hypothetical protein
LVARANFMRLSLQKAAHANLSGAACRKSGSHQRTWDEKDGRSPSNAPAWLRETCGGTWSERAAIGALAHLQIGRAFSIAGNKTKAKTAYQDFFTLWRDADLEIPILTRARDEYAASISRSLGFS